MTLVCSIAPFFLLLTCSSLAFASSIFLSLLQCSVLGLPMTVRSHSSGCSICTHLAEAFSYQVPFWILPCKVLELFSVSNFQEKNRTKLLALGLLETVFPQAHKILIFFFFFISWGSRIQKPIKMNKDRPLEICPIHRPLKIYTALDCISFSHLEKPHQVWQEINSLYIIQNKFS